MPKRTKTDATVTDINEKPKRAKQTELAGFEAPSHPELDALMVELDAEKSTLGTVRQRIGELNTAILAKAAELKISTSYRNDTAAPPLLLVIKAGEAKVKVSPAKGAAAEDEADDE